MRCTLCQWPVKRPSARYDDEGDKVTMLIRSAYPRYVDATEYVLCCCLTEKAEEVDGLDEGNSALADDSEVLARALRASSMKRR